MCECVCLCVRGHVAILLAHNEWMIMKLCMYVGYHDANNVSNFGGDPIKFKKNLFIVLFTLFYGHGAS